MDTATPLSPEAGAYLRKVRDLAENSLAQVEVMLAARDRKEKRTDEVTDTLDHGMRQLQDWQRQFSALTPPQAFQGQHDEIRHLLADLGRMARSIRSLRSVPPTHPVRERLAGLHDHLERVLNAADEI